MEIQTPKKRFEVIKEAKDTFEKVTEISVSSKIEKNYELIQKKTFRTKGKNLYNNIM